MTDLTTFQRLRDAAVRQDGIRLEAGEVRELFEREGGRILDLARVDDAAAFGASGEDGGPEEEEVPEDEPELSGLSAVSGDSP